MQGSKFEAQEDQRDESPIMHLIHGKDRAEESAEDLLAIPLTNQLLHDLDLPNRE